MEGVRRILGVGSTRWLSETFLSLPPSFSLFRVCISPLCSLSLPSSFSSSFSTSRILLISWLKMSDTHVRTIDRSCASPQDCNAPVSCWEERAGMRKKKRKKKREERVGDRGCERCRQISSLVDRVSKETGSRSNVEIWCSAYEVYVSFRSEYHGLIEERVSSQRFRCWTVCSSKVSCRHFTRQVGRVKNSDLLSFH